MQDDKAGVLVVVFTDDVYQFPPGFRFHVRRVHRRIELVRVYREGKLLKFGYMLLQLLEIEVFECSGFRVFYHTDGSARVY